MVYAYVLAVARDVTAQKGDKVLKAWRYHLLTVTFSFEVVSGVETLFWKANNLREDLRGRFDACVRTTVQRIVGMASFKKTKESKDGAGSATYVKVAKAYVTNLKQGQGAEKITEKYCEIALKVHDNLFAIPHVKTVIFSMEERYNHKSPFNSLYRMKAIVDRVKDPAMLVWVFNCIEDGYKCGIYNEDHQIS